MRRILPLILAILLLGACAPGNNPQEPTATESPTAPPADPPIDYTEYMNGALKPGPFTEKSDRELLDFFMLIQNVAYNKASDIIDDELFLMAFFVRGLYDDELLSGWYDSTERFGVNYGHIVMPTASITALLDQFLEGYSFDPAKVDEREHYDASIDAFYTSPASNSPGGDPVIVERVETEPGLWSVVMVYYDGDGEEQQRNEYTIKERENGYYVLSSVVFHYDA